MKDRKMQFTAWGIWWLICFIVMIIISFFVRIFLSEPITVQGRVRTVLFCAVFAAFANIILIKLIFPFIIKENKAYNTILHELSVHGMSEQLNNYIVEQYNIAAKKPDTNYMYMIDYAIYIAAYYCDVEDYASAYKYLDSVDCSKLTKNLKFVSGRHMLMHYYLMKLQVESEAGDKERADSTYQTAADLYGKYGKELNLQEMAELVFAQYDVLCGKAQYVLDKLESAVYGDDTLMMAKFAVMASAYEKLGNIEQAKAMWSKAIDHAKNDHNRNTARRQLKKLESCEK